MIKNKILDVWARYEGPVKEYILSLRDVRNVGSLAFVVLVLLISWSGAKAIQANYNLQQEVARLQEKNVVKKLQNETQKLQNEYYKTSQYREITARQNFGLASPGETVLLVPRDVALSHTVPTLELEKTADNTEKKPFYRANFEAWIDFFFHR